MRTLILSDLHLGAGGDYDTFAGADALPALLDELAAEPLRVLINGDGFDFLSNDDPLEFSTARATEQARAMVEAPATRGVLRALGRVLANEGEVVIRVGNHDIELGLPPVQTALCDGLDQPAGVALRMAFHRGDDSDIVEVGGARVLVAHGEHSDKWNRVDHAALRLAQARGEEALFRYPPGSRLVKHLLNPLRRTQGMRFADLLTPDFHGAALVALAVNPGVVKAIFDASPLDMGWELFRQRSTPVSFGGGDEADEPGLAELLEAAGLDEDDLDSLDELIADAEDTAGDPQALESLLYDQPVAFGLGDHTRSAAGLLARVGRAGLQRASERMRSFGDVGQRVVAAGQRTVAAPAASAGGLKPTEAEWAEARRLADGAGVSAVVTGHTHAARWGGEQDITVVNTGTWTWQLAVPTPTEDAATWDGFIQLLRGNPGLDPGVGPTPPLIRRFTAVRLEERPGGAELALVELGESGLEMLGATVLAAQSDG